MNDTGREKIIFHIDVNSAFLSWSAVERLNNGEEEDIRNIPSIIGGDATSRHGIVLAKSIPCKKYGIQTAEPIAMALRKCPTLKIFPPDFSIYRRNSHMMMDFIKSFCPDVEQVSIDECYMDFTPIAYKYSDPVDCAKEIKDGIKELLGFTVNVGISNRKVLAKMASDMEKPDKIHTLYDYEIKTKMWPMPVGELHMCGKRSAAQLYKLGIRTIGELANADPAIIELNLKSIGALLRDYANGIDDSDIYMYREKEKSISHAHTIEHDVVNTDEAYRIILNLSDEVARRLRKAGMKAKSVAIELRYNDFKNASHQKKMMSYTDNGNDIYQEAKALFDALWNENPIRLMGVRVGDLADESTPVQMSLFDEQTNDKKKSLNKALDSINERYGTDSVRRLGR